MNWTPRDPRRWGSRQTIPTNAGLGAITIRTDELCRAEGPHVTTWNLIGQVRGVAAADQTAMTWTLIITLGVGSMTEEFRLPFNPAIPWTAVLLPAQWVSVQVEAVGAVAVGGRWTFSAMAGPSIPWEGTRMEVDDGN